MSQMQQQLCIVANLKTVILFLRVVCVAANRTQVTCQMFAGHCDGIPADDVLGHPPHSTHWITQSVQSHLSAGQVYRSRENTASHDLRHKLAKKVNRERMEF
jgi:hypothetical protein